MRRSGKFYRKNETDVMLRLGLQPTKNSGSGWIEKEDGQSEHVICQLKSTDAASIKVSKQDLDTLQYNAAVSHKLPVFAIQFLASDEVYLVLKPELLSELAQYIATGQTSGSVHEWLGTDANVTDAVSVPIRTIRSSSSARDAFHEENEKRYKKGKRSAL